MEADKRNSQKGKIMSRNGSWNDVRESFASDDLELEIHFASSGFHQDAQLYGAPEDCCPEEHEDERTLVCTTLKFWSATGEHKIELTKEQQQQIFDAHQKEINATELRHEEDCREDYGEKEINEKPRH